MDDSLQLMRDTGIALRREMLERGANDKQIKASVRAGVLHRIRRGAYTTADQWA